jgi:diguanylate cyclase
MSTIKNEASNGQQAAEFLRLTLAKLGELALPVTAINYALVYHYVSGRDAELNEKLDQFLAEQGKLDEEQVQEFFSRYVCGCESAKLEGINAEILNVVTQILGSVVTLTDRTEQSNLALKVHTEQLATLKDPEAVLDIASSILDETRDLIDSTRVIGSDLQDQTQEIEQLKGELQQAKQQAAMDALTGLNNRFSFDEKLEQIVQEAKGGERHFCLLLIDIDHFKNINDTHGHLIGDKVLRGIGQLLLKKMRGTDYLARYGGEEFAALLPDTPVNGALTVAESLRLAVEKLRIKHVKTGKSLGVVTVSIGIACFRAGESMAACFERCDKALYRAKNRGRNQSVVGE